MGFNNKLHIVTMFLGLIFSEIAVKVANFYAFGCIKTTFAAKTIIWALIP